MNYPRCKTCKWWEPEGEFDSIDLKDGRPDDWRRCALINSLEYPRTNSHVRLLTAYCHDAGVYTAPDFGCIAHEPEDDAE